MKVRKSTWPLAVALIFCVAAAFAQDQPQTSQQPDPSAPLQPPSSGLGGGYAKPPAAAARGVSPAYDPQTYDPSQVTPDENTLAGATPFTVGSLEHSRNLFDPSISFSQLGLDLGKGSGQSGLTGESMMGGVLDFDRTWSRYHLTANYDGGEALFFGQGNLHYQFHDMIVTQQANWGRWHVLLRDDFAAAPGAAFTGQGMGGPGLIAQFSSMLGASLSNLQPSFVPSETIDTGNAMRYRNAVLGQAEYSFTRRSAFTVSASYGQLHFTNLGYINSRMLDLQGGYDYLLDPKNSVAVLAGYGKIDFTGASSSTTDYSAALAYGRRITGRLAFQIAAGPQQIHSTGGTGGFQLWLASVNSALTYQRRRAGISLSYTRGLTTGSGVFQGATGDTFSSTGQYQFTRYWTGGFSGGYAFNKSLVPAGGTAMRFDNWFVGGSLGRRLGTHAQASFSYGLQRQTSPSSCPVASCGVNGFQQTFGMTVNWHLRPAG